LWLYRNDVEAMRHDIVGSCHGDDEVRQTIKRVYDARGYVLDPHSAIAYLGLVDQRNRGGPSDGSVWVFLATAHPAKFGEIVEPIIGRRVETPPPLTEALARPRRILRLDASLEAVVEALVA
jgi:threonine synthase